MTSPAYGSKGSESAAAGENGPTAIRRSESAQTADHLPHASVASSASYKIAEVKDEGTKVDEVVDSAVDQKARADDSGLKTVGHKMSVLRASKAAKGSGACKRGASTRDSAPSTISELPADQQAFIRRHFEQGLPIEECLKLAGCADFIHGW